MENNKYLAIFIAVIAIGAIYYFWGVKNISAPSAPSNSGQNQEESTGTPASSSANKQAVTKTVTESASSPVIRNGVYIISYYNSGFKPNYLELKRGAPVSFVNDSTKAMRIASPETGNAQFLNQTKSVGKGGTYDYTFNETGRFEYSNMNNTADKGVIVVK